MTQEQYTQILPAYMGCSIRDNILVGDFTFIAFFPNNTAGKTIWGVLHFNNEFDVRCSATCPLDSFKLILRTFDQITDEESARFRQLADEADKHSYTLWAMNATKAVNYLRSIGIDCDGLIEAGYAIKEKAK